MKHPISKRRYGLAIVAIIVTVMMLIASAAFWVAGSVIVLDRSGRVASAAIIAGDGSAQALYQLPGNAFYAMPKGDGAIKIRNRDGSKKDFGYVTRHRHVWVRVP